MATSLLNVGIAALSSRLPKVNSNHQRPMLLKCSASKVRPNLSLHTDMKSLAMNLMSQRAGLLACRSPLSAVCAVGQTQTIERQSTYRKKIPDLGFGGTGFPPRDDGRGKGGGGGGGGGGDWRGWFFLFLYFILDFLLSQGINAAVGSNRRRRR